MKRLIVFMVSFLLFVGMVFADSFYYGIETNNKTVAPGDTVELHYTLWCIDKEVEDYEFDCEYDFDPDVLEYVDNSYEVTDGWTFEYNSTQDTFRGHLSTEDFFGALDEETVSTLTGEDCHTNKYVILTAKFKVKEDVKNTETKVFALLNNNKGDSAATIKIYKKSNDTSLKTLNVDDTSVKIVKGTTTYDVVVPYDSRDVVIKYECGGTNCVASDNGRLEKELIVGKNTVEFSVKAEDGTEQKYTLNINRQSPNKDAAIENISIKQANNYGYLDLNFDKEIYTYDVTVPNAVNFVEVDASCSGEECNVYYDTVVELQEGLNSLHFTVVAQSGDSNEYIVNIEREKAPEEIIPEAPEEKKDNTKAILAMLCGLTAIVLAAIVLIASKKKKNTEVHEEVKTYNDYNQNPEVSNTKEFDFKDTNDHNIEE